MQRLVAWYQVGSSYAAVVALVVANLVPLSDIMAAFVQQPLEALVYVLGQIPDLLVVLVLVLASRSARRNASA